MRMRPLLPSPSGALKPPGPTSDPSEISSSRPAGEIIQYLCAVAVAQELHFTRAAHQLHLDQSALSRHVQKLESSLGVKLFIRGERKVELTEAGEAFIPFAKKALLAARAGVRLAQAISRGEPQVFEVAYSTVVDTHLIVQVKTLVESARPPIPIRFLSVAPDQVMERLLSGVSHAAITLLPAEEDVATACILREELFVAVHPDHPLAQKASVAAAEIGDEPVIWPAGVMPAAFTVDLFRRFRKAGYVPNVTHEAQTTTEALGLVRERLGTTFIKTSDLPLADHGLKVLPLAATLTVETGLLHIRERRWEFLGEFISLVTGRFRCTGPNVGSAPLSTRA